MSIALWSYGDVVGVIWHVTFALVVLVVIIKGAWEL